MHTKFGHDLFRTFEYWIDEKAQKRAVRKKQFNAVMSGFQKLLQGLLKFRQQISAMMARFAPPEQSKTSKKTKRRKREIATKKNPERPRKTKNQEQNKKTAQTTKRKEKKRK